MSQVNSDWVADAQIAPPLPAVRGTSLLRRSLKLWRTRIGLALVGLIVLLAIVGPYLAPYGPSTPVPGNAPNSLPSGKAVLGTDYLGQDVLSRVLYGGRSILVMAVLATALGLIAGVAVGLVAAYSRNALDDTLMRGMDVLMALPQILRHCFHQLGMAGRVSGAEIVDGLHETPPEKPIPASVDDRLREVRM